ncbi:MAG: S-layer homology domain-containing protein [Oscillospiraceae bacterium]|nr:S-layer homology domain-containing protein [Oscillospiraceae bacterium]
MSHSVSKILPAWFLTLALLFSLLPSTALAAEAEETSHTYGEPEFEWAEDYSTCTATFTCVDEDDTQTVDCTVISETTATCTEDGETVYTASCEFDGETYSNQPDPVETAALGHTWEGSTTTYENFDGAYYDEEAGKVVSSSCTENGTYDAVVYCGRCGEVELIRRTLTSKAAGHTAGEASYENLNGVEYDEESGEFISTIHAAEGSYEMVYYCTVCGEEISRETITVSASDAHQWDDGEVTQAPTCTETGVMTYTCTIEGCGETKTEAISVTGHTYGDPVFTWAEDYSSCTATFTCVEGDVEQTRICVVKTDVDETGAAVHTASCVFSGVTYNDTVTHTHTYVGTAETTPATCTEDGYITVTVACTDGDSQLYTYTIPVSATGHSWDEGTETVAATRYTQGMTTYTCTECGETKTEYTNKVIATFLFDDVLDDIQYYFIPVYWAYDLGITAGTSDTLFSPSQGCTRAEFVTFLYRLAQATGVDTSTESDSTAFTDVDSDDYFYEAVLWAAENGITSGTSDTTFTPNRPITRREAIAMLYRYECAANGEPSVNENNPFNDVTTDDYAYAAILWAVEQGITSGTGDTTFSPANTCTRAMMVTFLYNYAAIQD